jgi:hypothetical protein
MGCFQVPKWEKKSEMAPIVNGSWNPGIPHPLYFKVVAINLIIDEFKILHLAWLNSTSFNLANLVQILISTATISCC